ncbi:MAG TPA: hypothetical protein VII33_10190 [Nakamurella sp.]
MTASLAASASVWTSVEVDFDNVDKGPPEVQGHVQEGDRRLVVPPALRGQGDRHALRAYPTVNSPIDIEAKTLTLHPYVPRHRRGSRPAGAGGAGGQDED